jgi:glycosyltransferase involved in cell wall biosynthesis
VNLLTIIEPRSSAKMNVVKPIERIVYLANARLPTEKAQGYQIVKMCEALAQNGANLLLLHPFRYQRNPRLKKQNVFDYYGVPPVFEVRTLPNLDIILLERFFPRGIFTLLVFARALLWGLYAALVAGKEKADFYYTRNIEIAFWLVQVGLPTVYEAHVVPKRGRRWLLQRIARHPALRLVVVLTSFIGERLVGMGFPAQKVIVLPDGVDLSLFEGLPSKEECRRQLGLPSDRVIIGYIGRFRTMKMEKGIPELVQAMAHLPLLDGREPLLLCVGGPMEAVPTYLDLARRFAVSEHRLKFVDRVPNNEVPLWMRVCDVVTVPWPWTEFSAYFTSPLKLFEYMASGRPIVASDLPSLKEVLRDGENAVLVKPDDSKALAEGIQTILDDPTLASRLAVQARRDVTAYTWEQRAEKIMGFIGGTEEL